MKTTRKTSSNSSQNVSSTRRKSLKGILAGAGAISAESLLSNGWKRPIVEGVVLPAHGDTSMLTLTCDGPSIEIDTPGTYEVLMGPGVNAIFAQADGATGGNGGSGGDGQPSSASQPGGAGAVGLTGFRGRRSTVSCPL